MPGSKIFATLAQGGPPDQAVERGEKAILLAAGQDRLPSRQREVLEWRVFEQLSYAEISERTGKSEGALRVVSRGTMEARRADGELRRLLEASP